MRVPALASPTGAPAPAAARTPPTRTPATAATGARSLGVGQLDDDPPTIQLPTVELRDRVLRPFGRLHLDESEAPRLTREPVGDHGRREHVAALGEELTERFAGGGVRKTAD